MSEHSSSFSRRQYLRRTAVLTALGTGTAGSTVGEAVASHSRTAQMGMGIDIAGDRYTLGLPVDGEYNDYFVTTPHYESREGATVEAADGWDLGELVAVNPSDEGDVGLIELEDDVDVDYSFPWNGDDERIHGTVGHSRVDEFTDRYSAYTIKVVGDTSGQMTGDDVKTVPNTTQKQCQNVDDDWCVAATEIKPNFGDSGAPVILERPSPRRGGGSYRYAVGIQPGPGLRRLSTEIEVVPVDFIDEWIRGLGNDATGIPF